MTILKKILGSFRKKDAKKILVVDDEPRLRELMQTALAVFDCEILLAVNGEEGVAMAKKHRPTLIIMDMLMPGMSGVEATERIRLDPVTRAIPVIMCTSMSVVADVQKCFNAGADDYVVKPLDLKNFRGKIQLALNKAS